MKNTDKYRLIGALAAIAAAVVCFAAYNASGSGNEPPYGIVFTAASVCFAVVGAAELLISKEKNSGAMGYLKPALFFVIAALCVAAAVWFFVK